MISQTSMKFEEDTSWPDRLNSIKAYAQAQTVAHKIIHNTYPREIARKEGLPWLEDWRERDDALNPAYGQTQEGLFLEFRGHRGYPSRLWTPWGRWEFAGDGGGSWEDEMIELLLYFNAKEYQEAYPTEYGEVGPIFALHAIGPIELPPPTVLSDSSRALIDHAHRAWDAVQKRYQFNLMRHTAR